MNHESTCKIVKPTLKFDSAGKVVLRRWKDV